MQGGRAYDCFSAWDPTDDSTGNWNPQYDNIWLTGATHGWVDHNAFDDGDHPDSLQPLYFGRPYQWHDGELDISNAADLVTVSSNRFTDHDKVMLIGSSDSAFGDRGKLRVTLHHNLFDRVIQRGPRARRGARVAADQRSYPQLGHLQRRSSCILSVSITACRSSRRRLSCDGRASRDLIALKHRGSGARIRSKRSYVAMRILAAAVGLLALLGQSPEVRERKPLRSGVDLTVVSATVFNAEGGLAQGLPRDTFEIYEDGERQPIAQFTNERVPIGLGLLLDVSDSMRGRRIIDARAAVERFLVDLLAPNDEFFITAFNHAPRQLTGWTDDATTVRAVLEAARPTGGTAIYDAVMAALPAIEHRRRERAALVIISDGVDTASDTTLRDLRSALLRSDAFVYAVAIDSPPQEPVNRRVNPTALGEITNPTGGRTEVVKDSADLLAATAHIAEELNSQYVLGYTSPHPRDGNYHSIRVRVTKPGFRVRARNGYVATR